MDEKHERQDLAERLWRSSSRYRLWRSAKRFFVQWMRLVMPGAVVIITALFLSKILWPPLIHAVWALPAWFGAVALYLGFQQDKWLVTRTRADALTDLRCGARGLFMAMRQSGEEQWRNALKARPVKLRPGFPTWSFLAFVLVVAGTVGIVLLPDLRPTPPREQLALTPVEETQEIIEVLEETEMAEEEYLEQARSLISRMRGERRDGLDPEDWRALDECREELRKQAARRLRRKAKSDQELRAAVRDLQLGRSLDTEEMKELAQSMKSVPASELEEALKEISEQSDLSRQQLRDMLKRCGNGQCQLSNQQREAMAMLARRLKTGERGLAEAEEEALQACGFSEKERMAMRNQQPGRGGINRGPGTAPLKHIGDTSGEDGQFTARAFQGKEGNATADLGSGMSPPDEDETGGTGEIVRNRPRRFESGNGEMTWHARLLPRHNDVLKDYFDEQKGRDTK